MLELRHLRALQAISDHGSLTAAAERLAVSQSALSHLITDLERRCGQSLLDRSRRPPRLTDAGERILRCASDVLPQIAATERDLVAMRQRTGDRLHLATECYGCLEWLLPAMDAFRVDRPEVELDLRLGSGFDRLGDLVDGSVDLVVTPDAPPSPRLRFLPLFAFEMVLVLGPRHRLAKRARIRPHDLAEETLVTYPVSPCRLDVYSRFLEPAGVQVRERITTELTAMIEQKVASGVGVAVLPRWTVSDALARGRVLARPLGTGLRSQLHAAVRATDSADHAHHFVKLARRTAREHLQDIEIIS